MTDDPTPADVLAEALKEIQHPAIDNRNTRSGDKWLAECLIAALAERGYGVTPSADASENERLTPLNGIEAILGPEQPTPADVLALVMRAVEDVIGGHGEFTGWPSDFLPKIEERALAALAERGYRVTSEETLRYIVTMSGDDPSDLDAVHGEALEAWARRAVDQLRQDYNELLDETDGAAQLQAGRKEP